MYTSAKNFGCNIAKNQEIAKNITQQATTCISFFSYRAEHNRAGAKQGSARHKTLKNEKLAVVTANPLSL